MEISSYLFVMLLTVATLILAVVKIILQNRVIAKLEEDSYDMVSAHLELKERMKTHTLKSGFDMALWDMFVVGSRDIERKHFDK